MEKLAHSHYFLKSEQVVQTDKTTLTVFVAMQ